MKVIIPLIHSINQLLCPTCIYISRNYKSLSIMYVRNWQIYIKYGLCQKLAEACHIMTTSGLSSLRVGHCLLSDLDMKRCLTTSGLSSLRIGCCLLSAFAGDMKSCLTTSRLSALHVVLPVFAVVLLKK